MHGLQTLKDINEQEAATRALNAIRKSAELGKANRCKSGKCGGPQMTPETQAIVDKFLRDNPK